MICSRPGVADGDGATDLAGVAGLLAVGADDGAGFWPKACAASKNEMAVAAARFNIAFIVSWSPRREQYRADNDNPRTGYAMRLHKRDRARQRWLIRAQ
jgi:hypothetical protein